jgi:phosphatidylglycerophosphatase A
MADPAGFLAFGFGAGLLRWAPGTAGTVTAIPLALMARTLPPAAYATVVVLAFALGIWLCARTTSQLGKHDAGGIVWDEITGFMVAVALIPAELVWWAAAFVLFRVFDILKPFPVGWLDRRLGGGVGIMADDVAAGLYTLAALELLRSTVSSLSDLP